MNAIKPIVFLVTALASVLLMMQPAAAVDSDLSNRDVSASTEYDLSLQLSCLGTNEAFSTCEVLAIAQDGDGELEGSIEVAVCVYLEGNAEEKDCGWVKPISTGGKGPNTTAPESAQFYDLDLGKWISIKVKNYTFGKKNMSQEVVVTDKKSLAKESTFWIGSGKKFLPLSLSTAKMVLLGETKSYKITSSPKVSGTCALYRSLNGASVKVGSATLKNGTATGKLRWLWTTSGDSVPMTLKASCGNSKYFGEKLTLVTGIRK